MIIRLAASPWVLDLLTHLWQSSVVAAGALLLLNAWPRLSPRTRCTLGYVALLKFALPLNGVAAACSRWFAGLTAPADSPALPAFLIPTDGGTATLPGAHWAPPPWLWTALAAGWALVTLTVLATWMSRAAAVRRNLRVTATGASPAVEALLFQAARRVGLRAVPRCLTVPAPHAPAVVGLFQPVVILPQGLAENLASGELESILIHECLHVRRRDNLANAVRAVFVAALWFNPLAWLLNRAIALETEKACDEGVLRLTGDPATYAESIVASVRHALGAAPRGLSAVTTPPVLARLEAILSPPRRPRHRMPQAIALSTVIVLAGLSGRTGSVAAGAPPAELAAAAPISPAADSAAMSGVTYKVGAIILTFHGIGGADETLVRGKMTLRPGAPFDEQALDRDIRALYATGHFKTIEVTHSPAGAATLDLQVDLTFKPAMVVRATPGETGAEMRARGIQNAARQALTGERSEAAPDAPAPADIQGLEEELRAARLKADAANAELKALSEEHDAKERKLREIQRLEAAAARVEASAKAKAATDAPQRANRPTRLTISPAPRKTGPLEPSNTPAEFDGKPVFDISALDQGPSPRFQARPRYPFEMRRNGIGGEVLVDLIVNELGDVVNPTALRSTREEFEAAAVQAVAQWKFKPGVKNGQPVMTHLQIPIVFTLAP
jgi:TonB family protein